MGQATAIPYAISCVPCEIVASRVATLGRPTDPAMLDENLPDLTRDGRGRYFAIAQDRASVLVFSPEGAYLTALGRRGQGPGEFQRGITRIRAGHGDSLYVLDGQHQLSVYSTDLAFVRRVQLPGTGSGAAILADGRVVVSGRVPAPAAAGYSLHLLGLDGGVERSFGTDSPQPVPGQPRSQRPMILSIDDASVWTWSSDYQLEQWGIDGKRGTAITVTDVPWLPASKPPTISPPVTGPGGSVGDIFARMQQLTAALNAVIDTARPRPGMDIAGVGAGGRVWINAFRVDTSSGAVRMVHLMEVVDVSSRSILTSRSVIMSGLRFITNDLAYTTETDKDGFASISIWRLALRKP
jgi:hypothetical protein